MILGDFWAYDHSETFTSLSYFWKMNVLKKKSRNYFDSENWPILSIIIYQRASYCNTYKSDIDAVELSNVDIY